jgi:hypothetical protein
MSSKQVTASITISDLKDGLDVDTTNCVLASTANEYSTAAEVNDDLKFLEYGFIGLFKPYGGKIKFRFKSSGFIPINGIIKYGKNQIKKIRVELNSTFDYEIDFKTTTNQVIYLYGNIALHLLSGSLVDVMQWGTTAQKDSNSTLGSTVLVGGERILKDFPQIIWTALDLPNFQYITNMDEFCLGSKLNIDMSSWNVENVASHVNFIDESNESILPTFPEI